MSAIAPLCFQKKVEDRNQFEKDFTENLPSVANRIAQTIEQRDVREIFDRVQRTAWNPMAKDYSAEMPLTRFVPVDMFQAKQSFMEMAQGEIHAQPFQTWLIASECPAEDLDLVYLQPFNRRVLEAVIQKIQTVKARILPHSEKIPIFQVRLKAESTQEANTSGIKLSAWIEKFSAAQDNKK